MKKLTRRDFSKISAMGIATFGAQVEETTGASLNKATLTSVVSRPVNLPVAKGHRVVVVGGGWSGLTIAKYLKIYGPELDVVLVERNSMFVSHPISGLWLAGLVNLDAITFSYLDAAVNNNYLYLQATLIDLDRTSRTIFTDQGRLNYDDLILAPGIDYDYSSLGVEDQAQEQLLKTSFPAGFISASEHISIKRKVENFKGGIFALNAPAGIYRCSASPYERACLIASVFKRKKIKGKVVLVDPREQPAVSAEGFLSAFEELYGDIVEYMSSSVISGVNPESRSLSTDFDEIIFDDAAIYPRIRGAYLLEQLGLADPSSAQMEAAIDPFTYNAVGDANLYIAGDCRPMPFSKSGNTARTEGKYLAKLVAARAQGQETSWKSPQTICYSMVNTQPNQAIMVDGKYQFNRASNQWEHFDNYALNKRNESMASKTFDWFEENLQDMFY